MSTIEYAAKIKRTPRTVQRWCERGLIGKRIGGRFEIDEGTDPPEIIPKRKVGRVKRAERKLANFKRKVPKADLQSV